MNANSKVLLNLGSGVAGGGWLPAMFRSWSQVRIDIDPAVAPDVLADITDLSSIATGCADALWTAHCIEHLYEYAVPTALAEIRRVLKPDGFACLVVPDLQQIAAYIAEDRLHEVVYESSAGPVRAHDIVFGFGPALARGQFAMAHRCGFTPTILSNHLRDAGFGGYAILRRPNLELAAIVSRREWIDMAERDALLAELAL